MKEQQRKQDDNKMIQNIKNKHTEAEKEEIFNDDDDDRMPGKKNDPFNEMRETKTGFGAKVKKDYAPGGHEAEHADRDEEGEPAAGRDLEEVGAEEGCIDHEETRRTGRSNDRAAPVANGGAFNCRQ